MSDRLLEKIFGVPADVETLTISSTAPASGLLYPDELYRFDSDVDCSFELDTTNDGGVTETSHFTVFGGIPEMFTTPSDPNGTEGQVIHVTCSGISEAGTLHCTRMKKA